MKMTTKKWKTKRSFYKGRCFDNDRQRQWFTILNDDPFLTIANDDPLLTIVNDDPLLTIVSEERRRKETHLKGIGTYHCIVV